MKDVKELKAELKQVRKERDEAIDKNINIYAKYCRMEGMYAIGTQAVPGGMHDRCFDYVYPNDKIRQMEKKEREQYLIEKGYRNRQELESEYNDKIHTLEDEISMIQHGMPIYEWNKMQSLKDKARKYRKELEELNERKAYLEKWLSDYEAE